MDTGSGPVLAALSRKAAAGWIDAMVSLCVVPGFSPALRVSGFVLASPEYPGDERNKPLQYA